ncbi:anaphase-promoting complex subunit 5-like [Saccoglossus kowalevskii]
MILAFDKLSFSQVSNLYKILMKYCQTKENQHSSLEEDGDGGKLTKEELTCEKDDMLDEGSCVFLFGGTFSQRQAEFFIAQQICLVAMLLLWYRYA